ncbi:MAG: glycosyltransferase [Ilumatobacter sp.]|uniref:glycosyltransferase n=1 Tax=Ilumatobacter sp. TaxID=1967498 RepID=UPI0039194473
MDIRPAQSHSISIVVPVYRGETTLGSLAKEMLSLTEPFTTPDGHRAIVSEVLLVHDRGPDRSDRVIRELASEYPWIRPIWLSRNFGQHAATLAGMASTSTDWIVTLDEDGQHDPMAIPRMLDVALSEQASVVYAAPTNSPTHGAVRNASSRLAKWAFVNVLSSEGQPGYHSYRLVLGEIGRSVAAYSGSGLYLDVGFGWVTSDFAYCPVVLRDDGHRDSGYRFRSLMSHFWRLVLTSGTRPLRIMSVIGAVFAVLGFTAAGAIVIGRMSGSIEVEGWASLATVVLVGTGLILFSLGIVAEYIGVASRMALGKPPYLIVGDSADGPLGRLS